MPFVAPADTVVSSATAPVAAPAPAPQNSASAPQSGGFVAPVGTIVASPNASSVESDVDNKNFEPAALVQSHFQDFQNPNTITPADQDALTHAAQVAQERDATGRGPSLLSSIPGAIKDLPSMGASLVKGAVNAGNLAIDAAANYPSGVLRKVLIGNDADAQQMMAQGKADALGLVSANEVGSMPLIAKAVLNNQRFKEDLAAQQAGIKPNLQTYRERLLEDAAIGDQTQQSLQGKSPLMNTSFADLQAQGAQTPTPAQVADASSVVNVGTPLSVLGGAGASALGKVLSKVTPEAIGGFVASQSGPATGAIAQRGAQAIADAAGKAASSIPSIPSKLVGGAAVAAGTLGKAGQAVAASPALQALTRLAQTPALLHGIATLNPVSTEAAALGMAYAPRALQSLADFTGPEQAVQFGKGLIRDGFGIPAPQGVVARTAAGLVRPAVLGAAGGAAGTLPFLPGSTPDEQAHMLAGGAALGAAGGLGSHVTGNLMDAYFQAQNDPTLKGVLPTTSAPYGTNPALDAAHAQAMQGLSADKQADINRARNLMTGSHELYVLPKDQFVQAAGQDSSGVHLDGNKVLLNQNTVALGHELGHSIEADMQQNDPARLASLYANINPDEMGPFVERYNEKLLKDNPNAEPLTENSPEAKSEYLAEQVQKALQGKPLSQLGAKDRFGTVLTQGLGRFIERVTGSPLTEERSANLGAKPSFASDKLIRDYLDQKARNTSQPTENYGNTQGTAQESEAGTPPEPAGQQNPPDVAASVAARVQQSDQEALAAVRKATGKNLYTFPANSEVLAFQHALGSAADLMADGELSSPMALEKYLGAHLSDSPVWKSLSPGEKSAMADAVIDRPGEVHSMFEPGGAAVQAPAKAPALATVNGNSRRPAATALSEAQATPQVAAPSGLMKVPARTGVPNIRVGKGRAPTEEFERFNENDFHREPVAPGLRPGTRRTIGEGGLPVEEPQDYLVGAAFDRTNPKENAMLDQMAKNSGDAPRYLKMTHAVEEAIKNGENLSIGHLSAPSENVASPTKAERGQAQKEANVGLSVRKPVEKSLAPTGILVRPNKEEAVFTKESVQNAKARAKAYYLKASTNRSLKPAFGQLKDALAAIADIAKKRGNGEPAGDYEYRQAAEVDKFLDKEEKPVAYVTGYSPDKVIANAHNLAKAFTESDLLKDPSNKTIHAYLTGKDVATDLYNGNQNALHGYRRDGKTFLGANGEDVNAAWRDPHYNPVSIDDWKVQVLNVLEGGPSGSHFPEANANAATAGRPPVPDKDTGANPFLNKLKGLKKDLKLTSNGKTVAGVENILDSAQETVRMDRITRHYSSSPITVPPSSYSQRAAAFLPKGEEEKASDPYDRDRFGIAPSEQKKKIQPPDKQLLQKLSALSGFGMDAPFQGPSRRR